MQPVGGQARPGVKPLPVPGIHPYSSHLNITKARNYPLFNIIVVIREKPFPAFWTELFLEIFLVLFKEKEEYYFSR
jgi:hypothetical protein